ncbi:MAG: hypothetical protein Tp138OMZ00d2C19078241_57 [Prokaryotic dsDNA virus sp.]|jgi:hypothetical protein|nr:MAG: hypothetical protein Tp138OMZ00d2C19078241_57 [Prokaryotic dsDNA virus sp.]|tara:strand:+ start:9282 stop:9608 length:327 start_codon:yes stop_codon:yes gene_type:complete
MINKTMSKHTPGPWVVEEERRYPIDITTESGRVICEVDCDSVWNEFNETVRDPTEEQLANANLIAAAPKLLEALRFCVKAFPIAGESEIQDEARLKALDAINEAEDKS